MSDSEHMHWDHRDGQVAAIAAAVVYCAWALEILFPEGGTAPGALARPGSDFGHFLASAHRMASILVLVAVVLGFAMGRSRQSRRLVVSWCSAAVFGAASLVASLLPGRCVVAIDAACAAETLVEGVEGATAAQAVTAVVAILAGVVAAVFLAGDRRRAGDRAWPLVAAVAAFQAVTAAAVLALAAWNLWGPGAAEPGVALGLLERAHLVAVSLWLLIAGLLPRLWRRTDTGRRAALNR
ncbi:DUF998 domain-containing protein [Nocardiopsis algeriensis]|uniref:DUF998 domain-containing protein n=1 Tax=Nocardiopsis algeriensis TaxID=1478215 RepID=UPI003B42A253